MTALELAQVLWDIKVQVEKEAGHQIEKSFPWDMLGTLHQRQLIVEAKRFLERFDITPKPTPEAM